MPPDAGVAVASSAFESGGENSDRSDQKYEPHGGASLRRSQTGDHKITAEHRAHCYGDGCHQADGGFELLQQVFSRPNYGQCASLHLLVFDRRKNPRR